MTIGHESHRLDEPFLVLATQNPVEHEGTFPLPEAQLDRFLFQVRVTYPSREEELEILTRQVNAATASPRIEAVVTAQELLAARAALADVFADQRVLAYVLDLVRATRDPAGLQAAGGGAAGPLRRLAARGGPLQPGGARHRRARRPRLRPARGRQGSGDGRAAPPPDPQLRRRGRQRLGRRGRGEDPGGGARPLHDTSTDAHRVRTMALDIGRLRASAHRVAFRFMRPGSVPTPGVHRSLFRGHGLNFAGYREYQHGDDIRMVDWNVTARQNRPMLKLFEQEHASALMLVLDASASMTGPHPDKWDAAAALAVLFAFVAARDGERIGLAVTGEKGLAFSPAARLRARDPPRAPPGAARRLIEHHRRSTTACTAPCAACARPASSSSRPTSSARAGTPWSARRCAATPWSA